MASSGLGLGWVGQPPPFNSSLPLTPKAPDPPPFHPEPPLNPYTDSNPFKPLQTRSNPFKPVQTPRWSASQVYGASRAEGEALRAPGGKLRLEPAKGGDGKLYLPIGAWGRGFLYVLCFVWGSGFRGFRAGP
jgi:hypothetical protein